MKLDKTLLRKLPKVLLHEHLDGVLRPETVIELAKSAKYLKLPTNDPHALAQWFHQGANQGSLAKYLEGFAHTIAVMQTEEALERVAFEQVEDLSRDGVVYFETRFAPVFHTKKGLTHQQVVSAVLKGLERARKTFGVPSGLIICAMRNMNVSLEMAELAVDFRERGVVGFDLAGEEGGYPPKKHVEAFHYIQRMNFNITIHAGEGYGKESIWQAIQYCGAHRIGHGTRLFCRYSTDERWLAPHFEKMLTDQALLARAYVHAWQVTGDPDHLQVATETIEYTLGELGGPDGSLFSSEDADAAGVEGGHATFTTVQVRDALEGAGRPDLVEPALRWYGIEPGGNWEGVTVLHRPLGATLHRPDEVEEARRLLLAARLTRPRPAVDDKVLTEWNAMFAATLAEAAAATGSKEWAARAEQIMDFLFDQLRRPGDGRWLRSWQGGRARHLALAGDLAWVVDACTRVGELTGRAMWTERAAEAADDLLSRFWDDEAGGVFTTGHDADALIVRPKDLTDGAIPSANSASALALLRLGSVTGDERYRRAGERIVEWASPLLAAQPSAVADLAAATALVNDAMEIVVAGDRPDLLEPVRQRWLPSAVLAWGEPTPSPLWTDRTDGFAYVCRGFTCRLPTGDPEDLGRQLDDAGAAADTGAGTGAGAGAGAGGRNKPIGSTG